MKIIINVSIRNRPSVSVRLMAADAAGKSWTYKSLTRRKKENNSHMGLGWEKVRRAKYRIVKCLLIMRSQRISIVRCRKYTNSITLLFL